MTFEIKSPAPAKRDRKIYSIDMTNYPDLDVWVKEMADTHGTTVSDIIRQCLEFASRQKSRQDA